AAKVPPCIFDAVTHLEDGAIGLDPATRSVRVVVRGAGLRAPAEACFRAQFPGAKIADEGAVTQYQAGKTSLYVLWRGDSLALAAPGADAAATAALAETPSPIRRDDRMRALLGRVDTSQWYWFVADVPRLDKERTLEPRPDSVWGTMEEKTMRVTGAFSSADQAAKLASLVKQFVAKVPPAARPFVEDLTVDTEGANTVLTLPYGKAMAAVGIGEKDVP